MNKKIRALTLLSGGLDSAIATRLVLDQGIECVGINFTSPFCTCDYGGKCFSKIIAKDLDVQYIALSKGEEFIDVVKNPKHGYGQGLNPCVDCKIFILKKAKELMGKYDADFVITGEVLGQRPMSQHKKALQIIEKDSGLEGLILRPLSAHFLEETIPEKKGWINRNELLSIQGRSRKEQLKLAKNFSLTTYSCAGGGCLLTEKKYAHKLKDLIDHQDNITYKDINLLKIGRHFRYNGIKIVSGKNETENNKLLASNLENVIIMDVPNFGSPTTVILDSDPGLDIIKFAGELTAFYSKCDDVKIIVKYIKNGVENTIEVNKKNSQDIQLYNLAYKKFTDKKMLVNSIK